MLIVDEPAIHTCFSMAEAITAAKEAAVLYTQGKAQVPLRTSLAIGQERNRALFMPAYVSGEAPALGIKIVSVLPTNRDKGLPTIPAQMLLMDADTGFITAMLDGEALTCLRTGAVVGAATEMLARKDARVMALIGAGGQARAQAEAVLAVRKIEELRIFSPSKESRSALADDLQKQYPDLRVRVCASAQACVEGADIITTVTTSKTPTFPAEAIKPGVHINGVGSYTPDAAEIDVALLQRAQAIYCDTLNGVLAEAGDVVIPMQNGALARERITGELGQLLLGQTAGRTDDADITVFKSVGSAVLDVVTAQQIFAKAQQMGLGRQV
ncbi:MAG: hypothetical protein Q4G39_05725 [Brachymonas sp.]|nr:hypothetical protein [Brachymonas sp.]